MNTINPKYSYKFVIAFFIILSVYLIWITAKFSSNVAFSDQIDIFFGYLTNQNLTSLFLQQHGPHRQGFGTALMLPTLWLSNWNFSVVSYLTALIMILSAYILIISLRISQINQVTAIACVLLVLSLGAAELLIVTPNISHSSLPVLFSLMIFWLALKNTSNLITIGFLNLIIVIFSLFTGFGIFLFLSFFIILTIRLTHQILFTNKIDQKFFLLYIFSCSVAFVSVFIFFDGYSKATAEGCAPSAIDNIWEVLVYSLSVASVSLGGSKLGLFSMPVGLFAVIGLFVISYVSTKRLIYSDDRSAAGVLLLVLFSLFFIFSTALGRHCLGDNSAFSQRYYPITSIGLVGALIGFNKWYRNYFYSLMNKILSIIVILLSISLVFPSGYNLILQYNGHKNNFILCLKNIGSVKDCNEKFFIYPDYKRLDAFLHLISR